MTSFCLFATAGNTSLFLPARSADLSALRRAMGLVVCEQAALVDLKKGQAHMAGGEFCVNACLAFAALSQITGKSLASMSMADQNVGLRISGAIPRWEAEARFPAAIFSIATFSGIPVVSLPGIVHALIEIPSAINFPENAIEEATKIWAGMPLKNVPAYGVIWWSHIGSGFRILPVVHVPEAGTCNIEAACGSGSLALAMLLPDGAHLISQPSGNVLTVVKAAASLSLRGPVELLAKGDLWL